jgi:hypothetical protein
MKDYLQLGKPECQKQKNVLESEIYLSSLVVDVVKNLWREKAFRYDKGRKLVKNCLRNFIVMLLDYAKGINIL